MIDKRLVFNLSGLNAASVRHVEYVLTACSGDNQLAQLFTSTLENLESLVQLVSIEIDSCCSDIHYWETILLSTEVEVNVLSVHMKIYQYAKFVFNKLFPSSDAASPSAKKVDDRGVDGELQNVTRCIPDNIQSKDWPRNADQHLFVLRFGLQRLYCMLASIKEASEYLKRVHREIAVSTQRTVTLRSRKQPATFGKKMADDMCNFAYQNIFYCLRDLMSTIRIFDLRDINSGKSESLVDRLTGYFIGAYKSCGLKLINDSPPIANRMLLGLESVQSGGVISLKDDNAVGDEMRTSNAKVLNNLQVMLGEVNTKLRGFRGSQGGYPLQGTEVSARRPSRSERLWLRNLVLLSVVAYSGNELFGMYRSGHLKQLFDRASASISENVSQHLIEPMKSLTKYLYHRIEKTGEVIVTRRELRDSRRDLKEMLDASLDKIYKRNTGIAERWDDFKNYVEYAKDSLTILPKLRESGHFGDKSAPTDESKSASSSMSLTSSKSKPALKVYGEGIKPFEIDQSLEAPGFDPRYKGADKLGYSEAIIIKEIADRRAAGQGDRASLDVDNISDEYLDAAMEHVMKRYKDDQQFPVFNIISGVLLNVSLIQMQKVKVMTEAAMLRLDQVLAENQLTMAGAAALPAVVIGASLFSMFYTTFFSNPPTTAAKTLQLRLILANVERALQEVYSPDADSVDQVNSVSNVRKGMAQSPSYSSLTLGISPRMVRERHLSMSNLGSFAFPLEDSTKNAKIVEDLEEGCNTSLAGEDASPAHRYLSEKFPGDESELHRSVPLVRSTSATGPHGDTFRYVENARLISRGQLSDSLLKLRKELIRAFTPRYMRWMNNVSTFLFEHTGTIGIVGRSLHANCSWLLLPIRVFSRLIWGEIRLSTSDSEYAALLDDVVKLESPEDEVTGADKIIVAARMRQSYLCFSMN